MTGPRAGAHLSRRRFIAIAAGATSAGLAASRVAARPVQSFTWRGIALGAEATLTLHHGDERAAKEAISACLEEVARLEAIFSLHRPDSALARLNRDGRLEEAPADLRILLAQALALAEQTQGAFDPTVQPLWNLYARHFADPAAAADGPRDQDIAAALGAVGWRSVVLEGTAVRFARNGMSVTLNGIAQGYITDKVGEILRLRGFEHVLVNMGEQLALGPKWDGRAWTVSIAAPRAGRGDGARATAAAELTLADGALATSAALGSAFDPAMRVSHILDARTGRPASSWSGVSVLARSAALADGLSTALMTIPASEAPKLLGDCRAFVVESPECPGRWL